jgi:hypothetical protein
MHVRPRQGLLRREVRQHTHVGKQGRVAPPVLGNWLAQTLEGAGRWTRGRFTTSKRSASQMVGSRWPWLRGPTSCRTVTGRSSTSSAHPCGQTYPGGAALLLRDVSKPRTRALSPSSLQQKRWSAIRVVGRGSQERIGRGGLIKSSTNECSPHHSPT